jgi:hypothetical protein
MGLLYLFTFTLMCHIIHEFAVIDMITWIIFGDEYKLKLLM